MIDLSKIKAIAFDLDGTLTPTMELNFQCWNDILSKRQMQIDKTQYFLREGENISTLIQDLLSRYSGQISSGEIETLIEKKDQLFKMKFSGELYPGVTELINHLKTLKIKQGIVTAGRITRLNAMFNIDFIEQFDILVTGKKNKLGKPSPEPYLEFSMSLNIPPIEILVVENAPLGIRSAKAAGMKCVAITSTLSSHHLSEADIIFKDFLSFSKSLISNTD